MSTQLTWFTVGKVISRSPPTKETYNDYHLASNTHKDPLLSPEPMSNEQHQQLLPRPVYYQPAEPMGNGSSMFDEEHQQLLPGPVGFQSSQPMGHDYATYNEQYKQLLAGPLNQQFPDAGQCVFDSLEMSATSAAFIPGTPGQHVSATSANNPDTFNLPAWLDFDMFDQPILGSGACTSSGLDDGMDNPSLFADWIPSASTCGIQQEGGHDADHVSRPSHDHDRDNICDDVFGNPASHSHNWTTSDHIDYANVPGPVNNQTWSSFSDGERNNVNGKV